MSGERLARRVGGTTCNKKPPFLEKMVYNSKYRFTRPTKSQLFCSAAFPEGVSGNIWPVRFALSRFRSLDLLESGPCSSNISCEAEGRGSCRRAWVGARMESLDEPLCPPYGSSIPGILCSSLRSSEQAEPEQAELA